MNKLCVHSLVWASRWSDEEGHRAIEHAAALGYDQIIIPLGDIAAVHPDRTAKVLERCGIEPVNGMPANFETDISSDDEAVVARGATRIREAIAVARDLGSRRLGGVFYSALGKYTRLPSEKGRRNSISTLARLAEEAKAAGLSLSLEAVCRYDTNLINTGAQAMAYIAETGSDNIFVHLDTFHMNIEETNVPGAIRDCLPRLAYLEFGESHRGYLGTGSVDFAASFRAVAELGYRGPIGFEAFSGGTLAPGGACMVAAWRRMWDDSDDIARHAKTFIENGLAAARRSLEFPR